jgi:hypothetical protein
VLLSIIIIRCWYGRQYLHVDEITAILQHLKGQDVTVIPMGPEKMLDGIGEQEEEEFLRGRIVGWVGG